MHLILETQALSPEKEPRAIGDYQSILIRALRMLQRITDEGFAQPWLPLLLAVQNQFSDAGPITFKADIEQRMQQTCTGFDAERFRQHAAHGLTCDPFALVVAPGQ